MQAFAQERQHAQPPLAAILGRVLYCDGRFPIELRHQVKRQAAFLDIAGVLGWIEGDAHADLSLQRKIARVKNHLL